MKRLILLIISFNLIFTTSYANELNGVMIDNNDGTYAVIVNSQNGQTYNGIAAMQGDGTLAISIAIESKGSETYVGIATLNTDGTYSLTLKNNTTGDVATGILVQD